MGLLEEFLHCAKLSSTSEQKVQYCISDDVKFIFDVLPIEDIVNIEFHYYGKILMLNSFPCSFEELLDIDEMTIYFNRAMDELKYTVNKINDIVSSDYDFFGELKELNIKRQAEWDSEDKLDLSFRALEFMTECGELGEKVKKLIREKRGLKGNKTDLNDIREEVGDAIITLVLLCKDIEDSTGQTIDIQQCTKDKFNKTSNKYNFVTKWN